MRARVVRAFLDLKEGVARAEGETFEVSAERFAEIASRLPGYVAEEPEPKRRRTANKARKTSDK